MIFKDYCMKNKKQYLLEQWDKDKNLPLTPETINHSSTVKVWWKCEKGHCWQTQLRSRSTSLTGCPDCFKDELCEIKKNENEK